MIYTFTLHIVDSETGERLHDEYHNFAETTKGFTYYRGGSHHPLEIELSRRSAQKAMKNLIDNGWTIDRPKKVKIYTHN